MSELQESVERPVAEVPAEKEAACRKGFLREYFEIILVAVIFVLFIKTFLFQQFKIPSSSMENTLLIGDHVMVNKFVYGNPTGTFLDRVLPARDVRRSDVFVFRWPVDPDKDFIKRCIGLPGDTVALKEKTVYVNGEPLQEPYVIHKKGRMRLNGDDMAPVTIAGNALYALGDNRDESADSRRWGQVPRSFVRGRAFVVWWSIEEEAESGEDQTIEERFRAYYDTLLHLFSRTRRDRFFKMVR
jgi:signal peptidase I